MSVVYSPDGRHIVSGSLDRAIRFWNAETGGVLGAPLEGIALVCRPSPTLPMGGTESGMLRLVLQLATLWRGKALEWFVAYSSDRRHILSGSYDKTIRIWDAKTGVADDKPLEGHSPGVWSVASSPDGRHITLTSTIQIWNAEVSAGVGGHLEGERYAS